ncbi:MAG: SpoVR family protein, partial [Gammaproteobacteria bacterium]|nr:SpoVR family protein [Gammaproteobacteria bacterium]
RQRDRAEYLQSQVNELWRTVPQRMRDEELAEEARFPAEPQENLLYFVEKHAPLLEPWQREIVRIVRKVAQYFYPQRQTKVMNEGWACFWHYTLLNELYDRDLVDEGFMLEFLQSHTNVLSQPGFDSPFYSGLNPYTLGFHMMMDIRRICEDPTDEDRYWFPDIAGTNWNETLDFAMRNFKDESFIAQFLSPKVIRDLKLFAVLDNDQREELEISAIHNEQGYRRLRAALADQHNLHSLEPNVQVYEVQHRGDRSLTLRHDQYQRRPLNDDTLAEMMRHMHRLWGFPVRLETSDDGARYEMAAECG